MTVQTPKFMKAAILVEQNAPLLVGEVELPPLEAGQVLVKIAHSGICGKQIDEICGKRGEDPYLPHLLGHEGAGTIVAAGPGVRKVKPDDRVVLHWIKGSGIDSAPPRFRHNGQQVSAGWVTTFGQYTVASENRVTAIPADAKLDVAALLGCAVTTGLGIAFNDAALRPGQSIAVFGTGGIGLNVIQGAALVSAYPIVAIDVHDAKLARAREFGATHTVNGAKDDAEAYLMDLSDGRGFDAVVDAVGATSIVEQAYRSTSPIGRTILAGVPEHTHRVTLDSFPLHFGRRIFGSHGGATRPDVDIPRYLELYQRGTLKLDEQISHRYALDDVNEAVDLVRQGHAARCLIAME